MSVKDLKMRANPMQALAILIGLLGAVGCMETRDKQNERGTVRSQAGVIFESRQAKELANAACDFDLEQVKRLLKDGANADEVGRLGITPLIWTLTCRGLQFNSVLSDSAIRTGKRVIIERGDPKMIAVIAELLTSGADPNRKIVGNYGPVYPGSDKHWINGYSAPMIAAEFHSVEVMNLLLLNGADPNAASVDRRKTALSVAFDRGYWLDAGPTEVASDGRAWANLFALLDAGGRLDRSGPDEPDVIVAGVLKRPEIARRMLEKYPYQGGWETIVRILGNDQKNGLPRRKEREDFLEYLREVKGVNVDAILAEPIRIPRAS